MLDKLVRLLTLSVDTWIARSGAVERLLVSRLRW